MPIPTASYETGQPPHCSCCFQPISTSDIYCMHCGFPLKESEEIQNHFINERNYKQLELQELNKKIKSAGTTLYVLAAYFFVFGIIYFLINRSNDSASAALITNAIVGFIFIGLGYASQKKPLAAIISGMVLFLILQLLIFFEDPASIFKGSRLVFQSCSSSLDR